MRPSGCRAARPVDPRGAEWSACSRRAAVRWQEPSTAALTTRSGPGGRAGGPGGAKRAVSNWSLLWQRLREDSEGPELVWHRRAREEMCDALLGELRGLEEAGAARRGARATRGGWVAGTESRVSVRRRLRRSQGYWCRCAGGEASGRAG